MKHRWGFASARRGAWLTGAACLLALGMTVGAQPVRAENAAPGARLPVVASFSILGDIVREVGGDDIRLDVLVGPLSDAHTFEPTPKDARALGKREDPVLILKQNLGLDGGLEGLGLEVSLAHLEAFDIPYRVLEKVKTIFQAKDSAHSVINA